MKKIVCSILAGSVFFASACSQKSSEKKEPAPSQPITSEQVLNTNQKIDEAPAPAASAGSNSQSNSAMRNALNSAVKGLMNSSDMYIKDANGNNIEDLNLYQQNPTQYYLVLKNKNVAAGNGLYVLKTSNSATTAASEQVDLKFDVYTATGDAKTFVAGNLGTPKISENLTLYKSVLKTLENKRNIDALIAKVEGTKLTSRSTLESISNMLFPTAYASTSYADKLMITAIVFTGVAVVSYIFGAYWLGNLSTGAGIVFWLLYWFTVS